MTPTPSTPNPAPQPTPADAHAQTTPSLRRRMASWLYEGVLLFGVVTLAALIFDPLTNSRHALMLRDARMLYLFIVLGAYFTWFFHKGQTLAMKTWRLRIVNTHGKPLSLPHAFLRYVVGYSWFLPPLLLYPLFKLPLPEVLVLATGWVLIWALLSRFHPRRQFWHDALVGTRIIADTTPANPKKSK